MPLLVLFDVDGTLFLTPTRFPARRCGDVWKSTSASTFQRTQSSASTIPARPRSGSRVSSSTTRASTITPSTRVFGPGARSSPRATSSCSATRTRAAWEAAPGAAAARSRLQAAGLRLALWTGNPESMARARMKLLALEAYFPEGQGAFGCDSESRVRAARPGARACRRLAGRWRPSRWATPRATCEAARATGTRSIAAARGFPRRLSGGGRRLRRPRRGVLATPCLGWGRRRGGRG